MSKTENKRNSKSRMQVVKKRVVGCRSRKVGEARLF